MQWYFIGALICIALTINDVEHFHVLETTIYLPTYLYNVFFQSVTCSYTILMVSLISKRRKSDLSIFTFMVLISVWTKKTTLKQDHKKYCPVFLLKFYSYRFYI